MAYTEQQVGQHILELNREGMSLRQIARSYKSRYVLHADIERILTGIFPMGDKKRAALGLSPICPTCHNKPPKRRPDIVYTRNRRKMLDEIARQKYGCDSWSAHETKELHDHSARPVKMVS